jgi:hypothetical protein
LIVVMAKTLALPLAFPPTIAPRNSNGAFATGKG